MAPMKTIEQISRALNVFRVRLPDQPPRMDDVIKFTTENEAKALADLSIIGAEMNLKQIETICADLDLWVKTWTELLPIMTAQVKQMKDFTTKCKAEINSKLP